MSDSETKATENESGRDKKGRFLPGNKLGTPWGPDNPPPIHSNGGRPLSLMTRIKKYLSEPIDKDEKKLRADLLAEVIADAALGGEFKFAKELLDRLDGPVKGGETSGDEEKWRGMIEVNLGPAHKPEERD